MMPDAFAPEERDVYSPEQLKSTSPLGSGCCHFREAKRFFRVVMGYNISSLRDD